MAGQRRQGLAGLVPGCCLALQWPPRPPARSTRRCQTWRRAAAGRAPHGRGQGAASARACCRRPIRSRCRVGDAHGRPAGAPIRGDKPCSFAVRSGAYCSPAVGGAGRAANGDGSARGLCRVGRPKTLVAQAAKPFGVSYCVGYHISVVLAACERCLMAPPLAFVADDGDTTPRPRQPAGVISCQKSRPRPLPRRCYLPGGSGGPARRWQCRPPKCPTGFRPP